MTQRFLSEILELDIDVCANVYGVAPCTASRPAGSECYQGFRTCQDKINYLRAVQTLSFTGVGAKVPAGQLLRPYIASIGTAPTLLDPEEGLARRSSTTVVLIDDTGTDVQVDPYIATRATVAGGTFWSRFMARNQNYAGRPARIKRGYFDETGALIEPYVVERFIIDSIVGPNATGEIRVVLKDPTQLTTTSKAPVATTGKLAVPLIGTDLQITLDAGAGAQYAQGWVRIGDEVIRIDNVVGDVLSWSDSTARATFGTEAKNGAIGDVVQQCLVYIDEPYENVIEDLLNRSGIDSSLIDLVLLAAEVATWLGVAYNVTTCLTDPDDVDTLLIELLQAAGSMIWWNPRDQLVKFKVYAPASPASLAPVQLTGVKSLIDASVSLDRDEGARITRAAIYFGIFSATANAGEAKNYRAGEIAVDADAEGANEYNAVKPLTMYSRWFTQANQSAMRTFVRRRVSRYRDAPESIQFNLDPKDAALQESEMSDLETPLAVDTDGGARRLRIFITSRDPRGTLVAYKALVTSFDRPYGFIAPNATADYPNNDGYAVISNNAGLQSDGSPGTLII